MAETIRALVPVSTVFGPFHRDPDEAIARELREALESGAWCEHHGRIEPGPHERVCLECGHGWPTAEALLADHAAMVERLNADLPPPPWDPAWGVPIVAESDPEKVKVCPHCSHDL